MPKNKNNLTIQQQNFVDKYLETNNASEAYRFAYKSKNMKERTIVNNAYKLLQNNDITTTIRKAQERLQAKTDLSLDRIKEELECIINARIDDYVNIVEKQGQRYEGNGDERTLVFYTYMDVEFKPFSELTRKQLKAIESVKQGKNGIELKLQSETWSIERICKLFGYDMPTKQELKLDEDTAKLITGMQVN